MPHREWKEIGWTRDVACGFFDGIAFYMETPMTSRASGLCLRSIPAGRLSLLRTAAFPVPSFVAFENLKRLTAAWRWRAKRLHG